MTLNTTDPELQSRIVHLMPLIEAAAELIRNAVNQPRTIQHKGRVDLVTETDLAVERLVVDGITTTFPNDQILAEEGGLQETSGPFRWIIDPIDGTTNFSNGLPHFCISVALQHTDSLIYGCIHDPMRRHHFEAKLGHGATLNDQPIAVSTVDTLQHALLATGFSYDRQTRPDNNVAEFDYLLRRCRGLRRLGAAALDLAYVAAGWLDGYWEYRLKPWDLAAGILLVREAGGTVTNLENRTATIQDDTICVGGAAIHRQLLAALSDAPRRIQALGADAP